MVCGGIGWYGIEWFMAVWSSMDSIPLKGLNVSSNLIKPE